MFAARTTDLVTHPGPNCLTGGPGSPNVSIGGLPAWRAVPAALGAALEGASAAIMALLDAPVINPVVTGLLMPNVQSSLNNAAGAAGNPAAAATTTAALGTLTVGTEALDLAWETASVAPGGQPAADEAYAEGFKALLIAAATSAFAAMVAGMDTHACLGGPLPHGPGVVTTASTTVTVNGLPLARSGDPITEAAGGQNPIVMGCPQVSVG